MSLVKRRPVTPTSRFAVLPDFKEITETKPEKKLLSVHRKSGGRNNQGTITVRHRGGGHRHHYRLIDFKNDKLLPGKIIGIAYDPNRSARIALVRYPDGEKRYILATSGMKPGDRIVSGTETLSTEGNRLQLKDIPEGTNISSLELKPGKGIQIVRAAGAAAVLMSKADRQAQVKLPSGEIRLFSIDCSATIGTVSNPEHRYESLGKAGRTRWRGRRSKVRGVAMNPVDHPLGGGEGKSSGGRPVRTPWGKPEGVKTRDRNKSSERLIVKHRE